MMVCPQMNHKGDLEFHSLQMNSSFPFQFSLVSRAALGTTKGGDGHCPLLTKATTVSSSFTIHCGPPSHSSQYCDLGLNQSSHLYMSTSLRVQLMNSSQWISKQKEAEMENLHAGHCYSCFKYIISTSHETLHSKCNYPHFTDCKTDKQKDLSSLPTIIYLVSI